MKFMHVADAHMDRAYEGIQLSADETLNRRLQQAPEQTFTRIVEHALAAQVDILLFVGDTFHQTFVSAKNQALLQQLLTRLNEENIQVVFTFGNHDYYRKDRYWFTFPENVHLFISEVVETKKIQLKNGETIAVSAFSYEQAWIEKNKVQEYPQRFQDVDFHLGLYHGQQGVTGHYAPFAIQDMLAKNYDYWALGHIHVPTVLVKQPPIIYPGTPEGHSRKEQQAAGVVVGELTTNGAYYEWVSVATFIWQNLSLTLKSEMTLPQIQEKIAETLLTVKKAKNEQIILLRVQFKVAETQQDVLDEIAATDFWAYIQQKIWKVSAGKIWLTSWEQKVEKQMLQPERFQGERQLLTELAYRYQTAEAFAQLIEPLAKEPLLRPFLQQDQAARTQHIERSLEICEKGERLNET